MRRLLTLAMLTLTLGTAAHSQTEVKREGNTFIEVKSDKVALKNDTKTKYTYRAKDGKDYPVYVSRNGKAFIVRVSKKSGREYKQYLPQVTGQLSKK